MLTTVQKVGPVLDLFSPQRPEWGASEVASALGTPKSSAHALLTTMAEIGLLERTAHARYRLGWRLLALGRTVMVSAEYRRPVSVTLQHAVSRWGETMHFAVHERGSVVYVDKQAGPRAISLPTRVGTRLPAHASAVGKMLLAYHGAPSGSFVRFTPRTIVSAEALDRELERTRERGIAFDDEESLRGVSCVAGPVWDHDGTLVGAVSLATSSERLRRRRDAYADHVVATCDRISRQLGALLPERPRPPALRSVAS